MFLETRSEEETLSGQPDEVNEEEDTGSHLTNSVPQVDPLQVPNSHPVN